jgi:hypothetical protein
MVLSKFLWCLKLETTRYNIVACFANAGTVEARSIESSTQQKENERRTQQYSLARCHATQKLQQLVATQQ